MHICSVLPNKNHPPFGDRRRPRTVVCCLSSILARPVARQGHAPSGSATPSLDRRRALASFASEGGTAKSSTCSGAVDTVFSLGRAASPVRDLPGRAFRPCRFPLSRADWRNWQARSLRPEPGVRSPPPLYPGGGRLQGNPCGARYRAALSAGLPPLGSVRLMNGLQLRPAGGPLPSRLRARHAVNRKSVSKEDLHAQSFSSQTPRPRT
jgi:hypothetical protein